MPMFDIIREAQASLPLDKNKRVNPSHCEIPAMGPDRAFNLDFLAVKWGGCCVNLLYYHLMCC